MDKYNPSEIEAKWPSSASRFTRASAGKQKGQYNPSVIEHKWQEVWEKTGVYKPDLDRAKKPFFNLMMFPYPSAEGMHVGNMYAFTGSDIYGRFKRMQGYDVFEPIGLDGFGIHSENYAIKVGKHPKEQAAISQKNFYRQLRSIGNGFDWDRTVETYDPEYYKWTQWIFIQLFKKGLAYRKKAPVNFCPSCKTVLADEQVIDAKCERCSSIVEKRDLEQWFFKITEYADPLLDSLSKIDWTEKVKIAQREWIGRSQGVTFKYKVKDLDIHFEMFDSVPQTFMAQTFTVIAAEHPRLHELVKGTEYEKPVMEFVDKIKKKKKAQKFDLEKEPEGIFTGRYIEYKPTGKLIPIWVASFVIAEYGSGVVNASAHDERDFAFAKKYNLKLHPVMFPADPDEAEKVKKLEFCYHHAQDGILQEPMEFKGRKWGEAREDIIKYIEKKGFGKATSQYHLRDWLISRQRYWGPPIPMINCDKCGWHPVPEEQLPVLLPEVEDWKPKGSGESPLAAIKDFVNTRCPKCKGKAVRETDVSDTFFDSSWYFFRYISTDEKKHPWTDSRAKKWLPVSMYIGGAEHSVLHLLYTRFLTKVFKDLKLIDFDEPFPRFYAHGLIIKDGHKMSKSKGNVVVPDEYIKKYGSDTVRTYLMFSGPFSQGGDFRDSGVEGMYRFLKRVWRLVEENSKFKIQNSKLDTDHLDRIMHKTIKKVTEDLESLHYNTAIASIMEYYNELVKDPQAVTKQHIEAILLLLAPFAPHMTEELWQRIGNKGSIHVHALPVYDPKMLETDEVTIVVQVNGKVRDTLRVESGKLKVEKYIREKVEKSDKVKKYLDGKKIDKIVYVAGKIISYSVSE